MNLAENLEELLRREPAYLGENGTVLRQKVFEAAERLHPRLLSLLLENPYMKKQFFREVNGVTIFDKEKLEWVLDRKSFMPDSYTRYESRIGLADREGKFIRDRNDVELVWPYKDCVLEGGQDKEDEKRNEVFYNETLAPDEVTRLLDKKVFCHAVRYTAGGGKPAKKLRVDDNLIIKGNNLLVLSSLAQSDLAGKVKCIYIDPPYNTGSDGFGYDDRFNHSSWLTFMKNRLEIGRELLVANGIIFVQCDDNEQAYLKVLMDEVFGRAAFIATLHCQMSTTQGMKVKSAQNGNIVKNAEYIHIYSKDGHKNIAIHPLYDIRVEYDEHYNQFMTKDGDVIPLRDVYDYRFPKDLSCKSSLSLKEAFAQSTDFSSFVRQHLEQIVRYDKVTGFDLSERLIQGRYKSIVRDGKIYLLTVNGTGRLQQLLRLSDSWGNTDSYKSPSGLRKIRGDWWEGFYLDMGNVSKEGSVVFLNGKKPERLIYQLLKMGTNEGDLILDFFLGSGTTAAVAQKMGRRYIGIEQMDYIQTVTVPRLQKVIEGEQGGISKEAGWKGGGSFVYCELKERASSFLDQIGAAEDGRTLDAIYRELLHSSCLSWRANEKILSPDDPGYQMLSLEEKKKILFRLVDKNKLYVNNRDRDDEEMHVTAEEKAFTNSFYHRKEGGR